MSEMKSLTLGGKKYDSFVDQQARNDIAALPKDIIDKVTSPFSETGSIIQCHPVEGYPLDVVVNLAPIQPGSGDPYPAGGGRNLLNNTASTKTVNGVTFTVNDDGTVTANGTATELAIFTIGNFTAKAGNNYIGTGSSGGTATTYYVGFHGVDAQYDSAIAINRSDATDDLSFEVYIVIVSGATVNNITFKPMIRLATETDATYAPYSNIRPISGHTGVEVTRCGKNLIDPSSLKAALSEKISIEEDKIIISAGNNIFGFWTDNVDFFEVGKTYTFNVKKITNYNTDYYGFRVSYGNGAYFPVDGSAAKWPFTVTIKKPVKSFTLYVGGGYTSAEDVVIEGLQLELGSTATEYEPYTANTYPVTLPETVYGGKVRVSEGETVSEWAMVTLDGTEAFATSTSWENKYGFYCDGLMNDAVKVPGYDTVASIKCSHAGINTPSRITHDAGGSVAVGQGVDTRLYVCLGKFSTVDDFKAYLAAQHAAGTPVQIAYKLATPTTIQLTPQEILALKGTNTVYADAADVTVAGRIDPEYLNNSMLDRLAALEAAALN